MNIYAIQLEILLKEAFFGLFVMSTVAVFNIYSFVWISVAYRRSLERSTLRGQHYEMLRFVAYTMLLVVAMLVSLWIWVLALTGFGFVSDWLMALLFVAGFFTTVGYSGFDLPQGWRLIPSIIAFTGLFSFAWATAFSLSMANNLSSHMDKRKKH
jgi:hypothetical protein